MDDYTRNVKAWLDERFRRTSAEGIYLAHQPIYGFRKGFCESGCLNRYLITYGILRAVAGLPGQSLIDVGGAEGYKAALIRKFSGIRVRNADLSGEACRRAEEIFGMESDEVDGHSLPYADGEFDIVLSSECIEHVTDYRTTVRELIRVAKRCVILTVPHDPPEFVERSIASGEPHGHIHAFDTSSFDYLKEEGLRVHARKLMHPLTMWLSPCIEARRKAWNGTHPKVAYDVYNLLVPVFRLLLGKRTADWAMRMDGPLCRLTGHYRGILFAILKGGARPPELPRFTARPRDLLDEAVPLHSLGGR